MNVKVVPINFTEDLENLNIEAKSTQYVGIEKMSITYIQPADTCSSRDEDQTLTIKTQCACCADIEEALKGEVFYYDISMPDGGHWSVEDGKELADLVEDFKKRVHIGMEHLKELKKKESEKQVPD